LSIKGTLLIFSPLPVSVEVFEFYKFRPYVISLIEIQKKLFKCIPVGLYGVGAYVPLSRQEIGKIAG